MTTRFLAAVLLTAGLALGVPAHAQEKIPKRPRLAAGLDSNDAAAYLATGRKELDTDPEFAARAYWWASRIAPGSAEAMYGRAVATTLADRSLVTLYVDGPQNDGERREYRAIDSLLITASLLDPFLHKSLDRRIIIAYIAGRMPGGDATAEREIDREARELGPAAQSWAAYSQGRFADALEYSAMTIAKARARAGIYARRGEMFARLGNSDSAVAQFELAIVEAQKLDKKKLVVFYQPAARFRYQIGLIHEAGGTLEAARDSYGKALTEDLSFWPAHQRLGLLALAAGDTAAGLGELDLAVQAAPHNAYLRYQYGSLLAKRGKLAEAAAHLQRVIADEPWYAEPYVLMARLYEASDLAADAIATYQAFLARSTKDDRQRPFAEQRLAALRGPAPGAPRGIHQGPR